MAEEMCACGQPLHYSVPAFRRAIAALIAMKGPTVVVTTPAGSWRVPRHYIALHGLKARDLPLLADSYGFQRVLGRTL